MTYESVTNVEWLDKPGETFEYNGYRFQGVGKLHDNSFLKVSRSIRHEEFEPYAICLCTTTSTWNYNEFYSAAKTEGIGVLDIFRCVENNMLYIPGANELFRYE